MLPAHCTLGRNITHIISTIRVDTLSRWPVASCIPVPGHGGAERMRGARYFSSTRHLSPGCSGLALQAGHRNRPEAPSLLHVPSFKG